MKEKMNLKQYREVSLKAIAPKGWLKDVLDTQRNGLTGHLELCGEPFSNPGWLSDQIHTPENTLGWEFWFTYEQHAYWVEGMYKTGVFLGDDALVSKAMTQMRYVLDNPDTDGYLGPQLLKGEKKNNRWSHAVLFRALAAYSEMTENDEVVQKLKRHYASNTSSHTLFRDVCNVETMLWVYEKTGDVDVLAQAEKAFLGFNDQYAQTDMSLPSLASDAVAGEHGVTYNEIAKLGAILYLYTGNTGYLEPTLNGYRKIDRDHLLACGVCSSQEKLSGKDPLTCYEICDIADYTWSLGYLLFATGQAAYADRIEKACFNAAPGSVTKDFKATQYFSCPNQVIADKTSNHVFYRRGNERLSYRPNHTPACCPANVNRIMPNYISRMWLLDDQGAITAALFGPSSITFPLPDTDQTVTIEQVTEYPFSDTIDFRFKMDAPAEFSFKFRVPGWCETADWSLNGVKQTETLCAESFHTVRRRFDDGDTLRLRLPFTPRLQRWPKGGLSLEAGPLVFSLPIKTRWQRDDAEKKAHRDFPAWNLYPESKWNYALCVDAEHLQQSVTLQRHQGPDRSWSSDTPAWTVQVNARQVRGWDIEKQNTIDVYLPLGTDLAHEKKVVQKTGNFQFTPELPDRTYLDENLSSETEAIELVPYGCTELRMTIFPQAAVSASESV